MFRRTIVAALLPLLGCLLLLLSVPSHGYAQGPRKSQFGSMPPIEIKLTADSVARLLKALPEITKKTSAHQGQFMGNLTGGAGPGGAPQLTPQEVAELRAIFTRYGFSMEEFAMQVSALLATYLTLSPEALDRQLPNENKPEVRALLTDPSIPQEQKDAIRSQIRFAHANKAKIREQLSQLATPANQKVVKPFLPKVRKAFDLAEAEARKAMQQKKPGPRRAKTP